MNRKPHGAPTTAESYEPESTESQVRAAQLTMGQGLPTLPDEPITEPADPPLPTLPDEPIDEPAI